MKNSSSEQDEKQEQDQARQELILSEQKAAQFYEIYVKTINM